MSTPALVVHHGKNAPNGFQYQFGQFSRAAADADPSFTDIPLVSDVDGKAYEALAVEAAGADLQDDRGGMGTQTADGSGSPGAQFSVLVGLASGIGTIGELARIWTGFGGDGWIITVVPPTTPGTVRLQWTKVGNGLDVLLTVLILGRRI